MAMVFEQQQAGVRKYLGPREIPPALADAVFKGKGDDQVCFSGVLDLSVFDTLDPKSDKSTKFKRIDANDDKVCFSGVLDLSAFDPVSECAPKSSKPTKVKRVNADDNQVSFSGALDLSSFSTIDEDTDDPDLDAASVSVSDSEEQESPSSIPNSPSPNSPSPGSCHSEPRGAAGASDAPFPYGCGSGHDPFSQRRKSFDEPCRSQYREHHQLQQQQPQWRQQQEQEQQGQLFPQNAYPYVQQQPPPAVLQSYSPVQQPHSPFQPFPSYQQPQRPAASPGPASQPRQNRAFLPKTQAPLTPLYSSSACSSPDRPHSVCGAPTHASRLMPSPPPAYASSASGALTRVSCLMPSPPPAYASTVSGGCESSPFNVLFPGGSSSGSPFGSPAHPYNSSASASPVHSGSNFRCPSLREQVLMRTSSNHSSDLGCESDAFSDAGTEVDSSDIYSECFNFADVEECCQDKELGKDVLDGVSLVPLPMHFSTPDSPEYVLYALYFSSDKTKPVLPGDDSTKMLFPQQWQAAAENQPRNAPQPAAGRPSSRAPKAFGEYKTYSSLYS